MLWRWRTNRERENGGSCNSMDTSFIGLFDSFLQLKFVSKFHTMYSKKVFLSNRDQEESSKRLRSNVSDLFLSGEISGKRAATLFQDATDAGAASTADLAISVGSNSHRDLKRKLFKGNKWPPLYTFQVPVKHLKTHQTTWEDIAMLLPHEVAAVVADRNRFFNTDLFSTQGLTEKQQLDFISKTQQLGMVPGKTMPLGLWSDGCPVKWDRSESILVISLNWPGQTLDKFSRLRVPLCVINKKFTLKKNAGDNTLDEIFAVVAWSFRCLATGIFPSVDHEGQPFQHQWRNKRASTPLQCQGLLVQIRGDWEMYKNVFNLKGWNDSGNCCYKCFATKADILDTSFTASWRQSRKKLMDHFAQAMQKNIPISSLFSSPGLDLDSFQIDWLHAVDLGVACDFFGNLMWYIMPQMPGKKLEDRCSAMFRNILVFYRTAPAGNRLDTLTLGMLRKKSKKSSKMSSPKLRASAGEARALVPWGQEIAEKMLDAKNAAKCLNHCYSFLSRETFDQDQLAQQCRQFCILYASLAEHFSNAGEKFWVFKPKFHMFQELCEFQGGNPSLHWTYRDEDFGGTVAHTARRRGGANAIISTSKNALEKFIAQTLVPEWPLQ